MLEAKQEEGEAKHNGDLDAHAKGNAALHRWAEEGRESLIEGNRVTGTDVVHCLAGSACQDQIDRWRDEKQDEAWQDDAGGSCRRFAGHEMPERYECSGKANGPKIVMRPRRWDRGEGEFGRAGLNDVPQRDGGQKSQDVSGERDVFGLKAADDCRNGR